MILFRMDTKTFDCHQLKECIWISWNYYHKEKKTHELPFLCPCELHALVIHSNRQIILIQHFKTTTEQKKTNESTCAIDIAVILIHSIVCTATHTAIESTSIHRVYVHAPVERYSAVDLRLSNVNRIRTSQTNTFATVVISRYHSIFGLAQHNTAAKILLLAAKSIQFVNRLRLDRIKTTNTGNSE